MRFGHQLTGISIEDGGIAGAKVNGPDGPHTIETDQIVLALGHSARDTFRMLYAAGIPMEQKQFAMGVRIEHLQKNITIAQYGAEIAGLPVASYKLSCHPETGRGAFSFCVCPGGMVVAAASEQGRLCTNGMSNHARDEENINGGLLVSVLPEDFGTEHPLGGVMLQEKLEEAAFQLGGGTIRLPASGWRIFLRTVPHRARGRKAILSARRPVDGSPPVSSTTDDRYAGAGDPNAGEKAAGL